MNKINLAVIYGGRSGEHQVSIESAASVINYINKSKYNIIPVYITIEGDWYWPVNPDLARNQNIDEIDKKAKKVAILPSPSVKGLKVLATDEVVQLDAVFPVMHGTFGEDGTIQGLLELASIPYVGAGVLASSVGMDKLLVKAVYEKHQLPQAKYLGFYRSQIETEASLKSVIKSISDEIGFPCFIKPANLGSSVGISKAKNASQLEEGLKFAAKFDSKIVVEEFIDGREIELSVLGNLDPKVSVPGEIVPCNEFYDYNAKYVDDKSELIIPAELPEQTISDLQRLAVKAYEVIDCRGLARVDFFVTKKEGKVLINEINTLPGFTKISMYPKLWEASGLSYEELLDQVVELAFENYKEKIKNQVNFSS